MAVRLAIVGSQHVEDSIPEVLGLIAEAVSYYQPEVIISGGAEGVDSWAAWYAREHGIELVEHLPAEPNWERGYKPRNILITQDCTHLVRIAHVNSKTYGSGWTADHAEKLGKHVERHTVGRP